MARAASIEGRVPESAAWEAFGEAESSTAGRAAETATGGDGSGDFERAQAAKPRNRIAPTTPPQAKVLPAAIMRLFALAALGAI